MPGWRAIASPTVAPSPCTMLNTPFGTPAVCRISARRCALAGAISLGLSTIVQPAASAGMILQKTWFIGQFQGVIMPITPTGSLSMRVVPMSSSNGKVSRIFSIVIVCASPTAACASWQSLMGAPISSEMAVQTSAKRAWYVARIEPSRARRSSRVVCEYVSNARRAATTAASTSSGPPSATLPITSSVAGLTMSSSRFDRGSTHAPST